MRKSWPLLVALALVLAVLPGRAQDEKKPDDKKIEKPKKERPKIEDALKRCYAKAKEDDELVISRSLVLKSHDADGSEALVLLVEYTNGEVGVFLGSKDPEKDQGPIFIEKADAEVAEAVFHRADHR